MHTPNKSNQIESTIESFELRVVPNVENESNKHREIHKLASLLLIGSKHSLEHYIFRCIVPQTTQTSNNQREICICKKKG